MGGELEGERRRCGQDGGAVQGENKEKHDIRKALK